MQPFWDALRRTGVRRPVDDRWVGGVCAGTARRLGVDPALVRVGVAVLVLLGGTGVLLYAVALVLLPDHDGRIELERACYGDLTGTTVGAVALLLLSMVLPVPWDLWRGGALVDGGELVRALLVGTLLVVGLAYLPRLREAVERGTAGQTPPPVSPHASPQAPVATPTTTPAAAPRPQRRGPGPAVAAAVTGCALLAGGSVWLAARQDLLVGRPWVLAACTALVVLGLGLVGLGVAGRRDGSVGGAAFLVLVLTLGVLLVPSWRTAQAAGSVTWRPTTEAAAARGGSLGLGEAALDLSGLSDLPAGAGVEVPIRVGVGTLRVLVPDDMDVVVQAATVVRSTDAGERDDWTGDESALVVDRTLRQDRDPQVVVDARVLVGDVELVPVTDP